MARRASWVALVAAFVAALVITKAPLCPMAKGFGVPCPGCGMTRATLAMARGDFGEAAHLHPLVFVVAPLVLAVVVYTTRNYVLTGRMLTRREPRWVWTVTYLLYAALFVLWIARFFGAFGGPAPV
jgi:hypothetical protein